jgi:hypothetical protein
MELTEKNEVAIVATVEETRDALELRLEAAEAEIRALKANAETGRRTITMQTVAKPNLFAAEATPAAALDLALASLSLEQRIAVKSEMLRAGLLR